MKSSCKPDLDSTSAANINEMRSQLITFSDLTREAGIESVSWADPTLPIFSALDLAEQRASLSQIKSSIALLQACLNEGHSLLDTRQLLWRSLRRFGWTPNSDVFDYISEEDTVEVYSLDQIQTFRNLQFFRFVSFTLEQIHSRPWYELTTRADEPRAALVEGLKRIMTGETKSTIDLSYIPVHEIQEVGSLELRKFTLEMRCMSPVFQDGVVAAIIAVNRTRFAPKEFREKVRYVTLPNARPLFEAGTAEIRTHPTGSR